MVSGQCGQSVIDEPVRLCGQCELSVTRSRQLPVV